MISDNKSIWTILTDETLSAYSNTYNNMQDINHKAVTKKEKRSSTVLWRHSKTAFIYIKYYRRRSGYSFLNHKSKAVRKMQEFALMGLIQDY